jgi:hypothetical protein
MFKDLVFFSWLRNKVNNKLPIKKGDIGIHEDTLTLLTLNETTDGIKHKIYTKVRVLEVYRGLVEVEVLDIELSESANSSLNELIKTSTKKYMSPKDIKWQLSE